MVTSLSDPSSDTATPRRGLRIARWRLDPGWRIAIALLVALRIGFGLIATVSLHLQPITSVGGDWLGLIVSGHTPGSEALSVWQRWDALWFQEIAEHGYQAGNGTSHFQPGFPLLVKVVSLPLLGRVVPAEIAAASAMFALSMWLLYRVALLDVDARTARLTVALTALSPAGFFLLAPYSEGLYLAMSLIAFWAMRCDRPAMAAIAGFAAGLTRTVAVFLVLPLAFAYLRARDREDELSGWGILAATSPVLGLIATIAYTHVIIGEGQSVFAMNQRWGYQTVAPWTLLGDSLHHIATTGDPIEMLNLVCLIGFTLLGLMALRALPLAYGLYVLPYLGLLYVSKLYVSPLASVDRYTLVLFPCFMVLARLLARRPTVLAGTLIVSALLASQLFTYWVHFGFVA